MKIAYRYTFSQFAEHFIAEYYSGGIRVYSRLLAGPTLILVGILMIGRSRLLLSAISRNSLWAGGGILILYGFLNFLRPFIQILVVRSRKEKFFGEKGQEVEITLDLESESLLINNSGDESELLLSNILFIQHRSESSWIITNRDHTIPIPRNTLTVGDYDKFIAAIENILNTNEQKY